MLSAEEMAEAVAPYSTVSDKIRALARRKVPRAEIARFLEKRYQHVRNVLEGDKAAQPQQISRELGAAPEGVSERSVAFEPPPGQSARIGGVYRFTVGVDGTIRLPEEVLKRLEIEPLTIAPAVFENDTFVFLSRREADRRSRALVPQWRRGEPLWSDELIAERRRDAAADAKDV